MRPRSPLRSSDNVTKTIVRTSVDMKPDMCIWRGIVEETGALVTLMWWPNGRMAGTVQERGRIYSIRHMGGPIYAMIEMGGDRMPQEHAPMPARLRSDDPNARDDPLVNQGDASLLRPVTLGMRAPAAGAKSQPSRSWHRRSRPGHARSPRHRARSCRQSRWPRRRWHREPRTSSSMSSSPTPGRQRPTTPTSRASSSTSPSRRATSPSA